MAALKGPQSRIEVAFETTRLGPYSMVVPLLGFAFGPALVKDGGDSGTGRSS